MRGVVAVAAMICVVVTYIVMARAITSPELTARYLADRAARTQVQTERERTERIRAQEWNETARTYGAWGAGALVVAVVTAGGAWAVVEWQRNRTARHVASETQTTQRVLIGAQRDVLLRWMELHGTPGAYLGKLGSTPGVFLPESGEFVTADRCRLELADRAAPLPPR